MSFSKLIRILSLAAICFLSLALLSSNAHAKARWIVDLQQEPGLKGRVQAAEARGCTEHLRTDRFVSFNCPQGQTPSTKAKRATRYFLHDSDTNQMIRASDIHLGNPLGPFDGTGVRVAVVDTGFDTDHPAIKDALLVCVNTTGDTNACEDVYGHGTAVSAIIAGIASSGGAGVTPDSVAPGAAIISVKVFPDNGAPIYSDDVAVALLEAVSWDPDVVNLSVGGGKSGEPDCDASGDPAVDVINIEAANAGIPVVVSSGNEGFKNGVGFPACASSAIAVGAVYQRNEGRIQWSNCLDRKTSQDLVTCFSNSGPALDVVAPGAFIWTASIGGGFGYFHGTSASAPVVSGAAALLKHQAPNLTAVEILETLSNTALELGSTKNQTRNGNGRIDSVLAAQYIDENFHPCGSDADCDDWNLCNGAELCDAGSCVAGVPLPPCSDGNACNGLETCDPGTGSCLDAAPLNCDDGDSCTDDSCDPTEGCQNIDNGSCPSCVPISKGRCNCDGKCTPREAEFGACGDCL